MKLYADDIRVTTNEFGVSLTFVQRKGATDKGVITGDFGMSFDAAEKLARELIGLFEGETK